MKTDIDIKNDIYNWLKGSELVAEVTGKLRKRKRLLNSNREDVCISVVANRNAQQQEAIVNVNIYVQDIQGDGELEENTKRLGQLSRIAADELNIIRIGGARINLEEQRVYPTEDGREHFINNRLLYKIINH